MDAVELEKILRNEDVSFCNMETGEYFKLVSVADESTGLVVCVEPDTGDWV